MGRFSKDLEASPDRRRVMDFEIWLRNLEVRETLASSVGVSHGSIRLAHWRKALVTLGSSSSCWLSISQRFLVSGSRMEIEG